MYQEEKGIVKCVDEERELGSHRNGFLPVEDTLRILDQFRFSFGTGLRVFDGIMQQFSVFGFLNQLQYAFQ